MRMIMKALGLMVCVVFISASTALAQGLCEGNFDCDTDVDGSDAAVFKEDFGRSQYLNPCGNCFENGPVPKTGQKTSYATGDDGDFQKGVAWPNPRFTDHGDGTVTDNLTGLIWLKNANCFGTRTWSNALSDSNGLNSGECGLTDGSSAGDWRLPNYNELFSLVNAEYFNPPFPPEHPFVNVQMNGYWAATTWAGNISNAWSVLMEDGSVIHGSKSLALYVWPVRGGH